MSNRQFDPEIGTGTRWEKGQPSPNPGGRPRKTILSSEYASVLAQPYPGDKKGRTFAQVIAWKIAMVAARGDIAAARELTDRTEGKVRREMEHPISEGGHIELSGVDPTERIMQLTKVLRERIQAREAQQQSDVAPRDQASRT